MKPVVLLAFGLTPGFGYDPNSTGLPTEIWVDWKPFYEPGKTLIGKTRQYAIYFTTKDYVVYY